MWSKDAQIDQDNLHDEAAKIPSLHAKYFDLYNNIKLLRERSITVDNKVRLERWNYYSGKSDPEVYQAEPFPYKVREKAAIKLQKVIRSHLILICARYNFRQTLAPARIAPPSLARYNIRKLVR